MSFSMGRAAVITILDSRGDSSGFQHLAAFLPVITSKTHVIVAADRFNDCTPQISELQCMTWHGEIQLQGDQGIAIHHGTSFLIILQYVAHMRLDAWEADHDEAELMQRSSARWTATRSSGARPIAHTNNSTSGLNPSALDFQPNVPYIGLMSEFVQDLSEAWQTCAFHWENEVRSTQVEVWFVDHARGQLHCQQPRLARLYEDYSTWEATIAAAWSDRRVAGEELEYYIVDPSPPNMHAETAAHIILIQAPHDQLVTSLLTVFETYQNRRECTLQNAVTTFEHIQAEHLAQGLDLHQAAQRCEVWYGPHQLQIGRPWPARSGYGLLMEVFREPRVTQTPVLLQLSAVITDRSERLTRGQVAHTHGPLPSLSNVAVEIRDLTFSGDMPQYLEVEGPGTAAQVREELQAWGHFTEVFDCWPQPLFVCRPQIVEDDTTMHYLLCRNEVEAEHEIFVHTSAVALSRQVKK